MIILLAAAVVCLPQILPQRQPIPPAGTTQRPLEPFGFKASSPNAAAQDMQNQRGPPRPVVAGPPAGPVAVPALPGPAPVTPPPARPAAVPVVASPLPASDPVPKPAPTSKSPANPSDSTPVLISTRASNPNVLAGVPVLKPTAIQIPPTTDAKSSTSAMMLTKVATLKPRENVNSGERAGHILSLVFLVMAL